MLPELLQDEKYPEMWRIEWPDGEISDMVNKTRANDAINRYLGNRPRTEIRRARKCPRELTGAFK